MAPTTMTTMTTSPQGVLMSSVAMPMTPTAIRITASTVAINGELSFLARRGRRIIAARSYVQGSTRHPLRHRRHPDQHGRRRRRVVAACLRRALRRPGRHREVHRHGDDRSRGGATDLRGGPEARARAKGVHAADGAAQLLPAPDRRGVTGL